MPIAEGFIPKAAPGRLLCGIALAAAGLLAQNGNPLPPPAKVVTLTVIARDQRDQPVGDLGIDDFQITDQGKPQKIAYLHRSEDTRQLASPMGPREYSNRSAAGAPHPVVILLDLLNASFLYRSYGADEIVRTVQHLESPDYVFLYLLAADGTVHPVHPLPDPQAGPVVVNGAWAQQIKTLLDEGLREVNKIKTVNDELPNIRADAAYRALETLAAAAAPLPGRKDILWITQGVPLNIRLAGGTYYDYTPRLQQLASAIDRAGVAIDTVDQGDALVSQSKDTIEAFPSLTGGKAYPPRSVEKAIPEVLASSRAAYVLEYAAPSPDGKFHKLRVTSARKGVRLQASQGYVAAPGSAEAPSYERAVLSSPFDGSGIGLWAATSAAPNAPQMVHVEIRVDSRDLLLEPKGDGFTVPLTVLLVKDTPQGKRASGGTNNVSLTRAQRDKPSKDDIAISINVDPATTPKIRVIVVDGGSDATGSLTIPIAVP